MISGHCVYWIRKIVAAGSKYDPAGDGPEIGIIRRELVVRTADQLSTYRFLKMRGA